MRSVNTVTGWHRQGFTLIELLVVMAIIVGLVALLVVGGLNYGDQKRLSSSADQLQQYLLIAKQRAKRDKAPRGLRLVVNSQTNLCNQVQYIGDQGDYNGSGSFSVSWEWVPTVGGNPIDGSLAVFRARGNGLNNFGPVDLNDVMNPQASSHRNLWSIAANYYLELYGGGNVYRVSGISGLSASNNGSPVSVVLDLVPPPNLNWPAYSTTLTPGLQLPNLPDYPSRGPTVQYRFIRTPQPLSGEDPIQLADGTAVDFNTNNQFGNPVRVGNATGATYNVDILFAPTGSVTNWRLGTDKIILWVRDTTLVGGKAWDGDPHLITVFTRTGLIASYPIDNTPIPNPKPNQDPTTPQDPYSQTRSGESSGL